MFLLKKLLAAWLLPPMGVAILGLAGLLLARSTRWKRLGTCLAATALLCVGALSLPVVATWLAESVASYPPISPRDANGAQAIVILGGGFHRNAPEYGDLGTVSSTTLSRIRYGAYLARQYKLPVLVSGGSVLGSPSEAPAMAEILSKEFGVPVRWVEAQSRDTQENAAYAAQLLRSAHMVKVILVSHAFHLRRASELFRAQGLAVIPAPTLPPERRSGISSWLPSPRDFEMSCTAVRELAALVTVRVSGGQ